jgi:hypothetical protein
VQVQLALLQRLFVRCSVRKAFRLGMLPWVAQVASADRSDINASEVSVRSPLDSSNERQVAYDALPAFGKYSTSGKPSKSLSCVHTTAPMLWAVA